MVNSHCQYLPKLHWVLLNEVSSLYWSEAQNSIHKRKVEVSFLMHSHHLLWAFVNDPSANTVLPNRYFLSRNEKFTWKVLKTQHCFLKMSNWFEEMWSSLVEWLQSLFWSQEMELTLVGLQYSGKTTLVNVISVCTWLWLTLRWRGGVFMNAWDGAPIANNFVFCVLSSATRPKSAPSSNPSRRLHPHD